MRFLHPFSARSNQKNRKAACPGKYAPACVESSSKPQRASRPVPAKTPAESAASQHPHPSLQPGRLYAWLSRDISFFSKEQSVSMTMQELDRFSDIRSGGLPLHHTIEICFKDSQRILQRLEEGYSFGEILCMAKGKGFAQLQALLKQLPLEEALLAQKELEESGRDLEKALLSKSAYPLFLMVFSLMMIRFFNTNLLPAMAVYGDGGESALLGMVETVLDVLLLGLAGLAAAYWLTIHQQIRLPGIRTWICSLPLVQKAHTAQLALFLKLFVQSGMSTQSCLNAIVQMPSAPFARSCAQSWIRAMNQGYSLLDEIRSNPELDPDFYIFFKVGMEGGCLPRMLEHYQRLALKKLTSSIQKLSIWIQLLSYSCVGALVICVYQVMLTPLQMLEGF